MLKYRLTFGPLLIAALVFVLWLDSYMLSAHGWPAGVILLLLIILPAIRLAAGELAAMFLNKAVQTNATLLFLAGTAGVLSVYAITGFGGAPPTGGDALLTLAFALTATLVMTFGAHAYRKRTAGALTAAGATLLSFVYLGVMPGFLLLLGAEYSAWVLACVILVTKSCDIGAYTVGMTLGKHKLIPWLSPGKTWEGLIGGLVTSAVVSALLLGPGADLSLGYALFCGAALGLCGQAGDLIASMLKRDAQIKDSGNTLPGFGGVLDVIDSPLLAGPVACLLLGCS